MVVKLFRCYYEIFKFWLSMLVVIMVGLGFVVGSGDVVDWVGFVWMFVGIMMVVCFVNVFN